MRIGKADVEKVAKLARLEVSETEKDAFSRQLSDILTYIEQLSPVDTAGIEPTATVLEQANVFREDKARPSLSLEKVLANAPAQAEGFFEVPKILKGDE
jgi:aspartyl-tRNA(Asn)/glutamyl-tRNA(Gln) amidotransferase subunit C